MKEKRGRRRKKGIEPRGMEHTTNKEEAMRERERTVARQVSLSLSLFLCCVVSDQSAALMRAITDTALSAAC